MSEEILVLIEHLRGQVQEISYLLLAAGRKLGETTDLKVKALLYGHGADGLAKDLAADEVLYLDHPELEEYTPTAYLQATASLIQELAPRLALFGDTSIGAELAAGLSARLQLPLVSYCQELRTENGAIKFRSQICGGKIMAEGALPAGTCLVTMIPGGYKSEFGRSTAAPKITPVSVPTLEPGSVQLKGYIEQQVTDVDISKEKILIAVGRGIQNQENLPLVEELAQALGGVLVASRPIVDQGWLPTTRLVGKSGKRVKPDLYLALGISGAPEHTEAITDSDVIIAINTDPEAPIFKLAKYGAEFDLLELTPALLKALQKVKV